MAVKVIVPYFESSFASSRFSWARSPRWTAVGFNDGQWVLGAALGAFIGLTTIGAQSGSKNGTEALKTKLTRRKAA